MVSAMAKDNYTNKNMTAAQLAAQTLDNDWNTALLQIETIKSERIEQDWNAEQTIVFFDDNTSLVFDGILQKVFCVSEEVEEQTIYEQWQELNVPERNGWFGERFDVTLEPEMLTRNVADLAIEHREFYEHEHKDKTTTKQWKEMLECWIAYRRESEEVDV